MLMYRITNVENDNIWTDKMENVTVENNNCEEYYCMNKQWDE